MQIPKRFLVATTSLGLVASMTLPALAASTETTPRDHQEKLVQALVQRFHLPVSDVQQFFQDQRQAHMNEIFGHLETRLAAEVKQGRLTEAQKTALLNKTKEVRTRLESWKSLSEEERKQKHEALETELANWLTQQGLDRGFVHVILGPIGHHRGPMIHHFRDEQTNQDPSRGSRKPGAHRRFGGEQGPRGFFGGVGQGLNN